MFRVQASACYLSNPHHAQSQVPVLLCALEAEQPKGWTLNELRPPQLLIT